MTAGQTTTFLPLGVVVLVICSIGSTVVTGAIPRSNKKLHLETFLRVLTRFSLRAPREIRQLFYKMEKEIEDNIKKIDRDNEIDFATEIQIKRSKKRVKKKYLRLVKN